MIRFWIAGVVTVLAGCVAPQPMEWARVRADAPDLQQALARCEYETRAATQVTDYSFRSVIGQELDRASRRNELMGLCMRAQGFTQQPQRSVPTGPLSKWDELETQWLEASATRSSLRMSLTANPRAPDAAQKSAQIEELNGRVAELERQLSYARSRPMSSDPFRE